MKSHAMNCPKCGAPLADAAPNVTLTCRFCGAETTFRDTPKDAETLEAEAELERERRATEKQRHRQQSERQQRQDENRREERETEALLVRGLLGGLFSNPLESCLERVTGCLVVAGLILIALVVLIIRGCS